MNVWFMEYTYIYIVNPTTPTVGNIYIKMYAQRSWMMDVNSECDKKKRLFIDNKSTFFLSILLLLYLFLGGGNVS